MIKFFVNKTGNEAFEEADYSDWKGPKDLSFAIQNWFAHYPNGRIELDNRDFFKGLLVIYGEIKE